MKKLIFSCFAILIGIGIGFNGVSDVNAFSNEDEIISSTDFNSEINDIEVLSSYNTTLTNEVTCSCSSNWNPFGNDQCRADNSGSTCNTSNTDDCQANNANCGGESSELEKKTDN